MPFQSVRRNYSVHLLLFFVMCINAFVYYVVHLLLQLTVLLID